MDFSLPYIDQSGTVMPHLFFNNLKYIIMAFVEHVQRLKRIDQLVRLKATGSAQELAHRLGVSRASVFRYMDDLKDLGAPVTYCRNRQTFFYEENFELNF